MTISTSSLFWSHRSFGLVSLPGGGGGPLPATLPRPPAAAAARTTEVPPAAPAPLPAPPEGTPLGAPRPVIGAEPGGTPCPGDRRTMLLSSLSISYNKPKKTTGGREEVCVQRKPAVRSAALDSNGRQQPSSLIVCKTGPVSNTPHWRRRRKKKERVQLSWRRSRPKKKMGEEFDFTCLSCRGKKKMELLYKYSYRAAFFCSLQAHRKLIY